MEKRRKRVSQGDRDREEEAGGERERERERERSGRIWRKRIPGLGFGIMDTPRRCYIFCVSLLFKTFLCKSLF